ncbi:ubiquinol-cytochrome C reductase UQCRX/QCR9-like family protein [Striga hermonthica]|uniref:Complex III subunit 9 n=1 Tax=Striga hermonthica TaxID=68872 RepID=A0A9N7R2V8_STRHE|nr:ubiquinol-cytochrome C reductase UQCRX/QCR9-like family protein [Striga hermonthica]
MNSASRRGGGVWEGLYRVIMRRTPVYVTFVVVGAFLGERAVDHGIRSLWDHVNVGKRYEDIPVLGQRQSEE